MSASRVLATRCTEAVGWVARTVSSEGAVMETWPTPGSAERKVHVVPLHFASSGGPLVELTLTCAVLVAGPCAFAGEALAAVACGTDRPDGVEVLPELPRIDWSFGVAPMPALGLRVTATELRRTVSGPVVREELRLDTILASSFDATPSHRPPKLEVDA